MDGVTLKQLRYFAAVMQTHHLGQAAGLCSVSQPALSVQIKDLEAHLGQALFERGSKGVRPTVLAEDVLPKVAAILDGVAQLSTIVDQVQDGIPSKVRLGVIPTVAPYLLPRIVTQMATAFPHVSLQVMEAMTPKLIESLDQGRIDLALLALPITGTGFETAPLFEETFVLVRPATDAHLPIPPAHILAKERLLLLEEGHCFRDQALEFCGLQSAQVRHGLDATNLSTLVQMVAAGLGITLIPEMAVDVETQGAQVAHAAFPDPAPTRRLGLIWRKSHAFAPGFLTVADMFKTRLVR
ncbi:MAG: hydrogen peroxide-inducible genes activator [Pseudomonadota bacterium]